MKSAKTVVVTGASAGLGRAIARAFAARGDRVALLARGEASPLQSAYCGSKHAVQGCTESLRSMSGRVRAACSCGRRSTTAR